MQTQPAKQSGLATVVGVAALAAGAVFLVLGSAPAINGGEASILMLLSGVIMMIVGGVLLRVGQRRMLFSVAGIFAVLLLSAIAITSPFSSTLTIRQIDIDIQYGPHDQGYFGQSPWTLQTSPSSITVNEGSSFQVYFSLTESTAAPEMDAIASIEATNPAYSFTVDSVNPPLLVTYTPGQTVPIFVTLTAPYVLVQTVPFNGVITLVLTTEYP